MLTTEQIQVVSPGDDGYDEARTGFALAADLRPAAIAYPTSPQDVAAIVRYAREHGMRVNAQGTGHNAAPLGDVSDTVIVRTERMRGVEIDVDRRRARVEAGAEWVDVTAPASEHGLAPLSGSSPNVGVVGYLLGGGVSLGLARRFGMAANSVLAIELVTADGRLHRVDADHDPDLFWALRGGGGSFGIVTAIEFELHPVPELYGGAMMWPWERSAEILNAWLELTRTAPDAFTSTARILQIPDMPEVPDPIRGRNLVVIDGVFVGPEAEAARVLEPLRALEPELDGFSPLPPVALSYVHMDPEDPMPLASDTLMLDDVTPAMIDRLVEVAGPGSGSPLGMAELRHLGGAIGRRPEGAGVVGHFDAHYLAFAGGLTLDPAGTAAVETALVLWREAMAETDTGFEYLNFSERPRDGSAFFAEEDHARLRAIKAQVDPDDVIRANHPIRPA